MTDQHSPEPVHASEPPPTPEPATATEGLAVPAPDPARARRRARLTIAVATAIVVAASAGWAATRWPEAPASGPAADFAEPDPQSPWLPDHVPDSVRLPHAWVSMNEALRENDRERFLSYATDDARDDLALWWDNTTTIGWTTAYIVPALGSSGGEGAFVGAELAFSARPLRGSGDADAGYRLTQGFGYDITTTGSGEKLRISSFEPWTPMPWDEGPIHVVRRDHVVLYGMQDEKALVDASADTAEKAAVKAIDAVADLGGAVPMTGFVSAITASADRMNRWYGGEENADDLEVAAYAQATERPAVRSDLFEPDIAVGGSSSGVQVVMGPLSADTRLATFTHEFAHGLHYAAAPLTSSDEPPIAVYEGFATYIELRTGLTERDWLGYGEVQDLVAEQGAAALDDETFSEEDAWLSYVAAGSYYLFLAENGGDPWQLALAGARAVDENLVQIVDDPRFSEQAWKDWMARQ
ncbi:hypothetical protein AB0N59_03830 [Microbacterium sp. NPDC089321]|uniref:hypothetical protein n=1 Tax=Microbacterium sp. NPDC089321 TaxID=3155183 RepID=UPI0034291E40